MSIAPEVTRSKGTATQAEHVTPNEFASRSFAPGTKQRFSVHVGELSTGSCLDIPVIVIAGKRKGPTVWIGGGGWILG